MTTKRNWVIGLAIAILPHAASADTLSDRFLDLFENECLPAVLDGVAPDLSGLTPYDSSNPDHFSYGPMGGDAFVDDDTRLLISDGDRNGYRVCEVSFSSDTVTEDDAMIADALEIWINDVVDRPEYRLVDNCLLFGFHYFVAAGSLDRNDRGYFVRILAYAGVDPDDDQRYGQPRAVVGETLDPSVEQCIEVDG